MRLSSLFEKAFGGTLIMITLITALYFAMRDLGPFDRLKLGGIEYYLDETNLSVKSRKEHRYRPGSGLKNPPEGVGLIYSYGYLFEYPGMGEVSFHIRKRRSSLDTRACESNIPYWPKRIPPKHSGEAFRLCYKDSDWVLRGVCYSAIATCRLFIGNERRPLAYAIFLNIEVVDSWWDLADDLDARLQVRSFRS